MHFSKFFFIAFLMLNAGSVAAEKKGTPLIVYQYSELGDFKVPQSMPLSVVKFNGKTYVLSRTPDRRLHDLTLNMSNDGREVLCGKTNNSLKVTSCYYVYFREK